MRSKRFTLYGLTTYAANDIKMAISNEYFHEESTRVFNDDAKSVSYRNVRVFVDA